MKPILISVVLVLEVLSVSAQPVPDSKSAPFWQLGIGAARVGRVDSDSPGSAPILQLQFAQAISERVHLVEEFCALYGHAFVLNQSSVSNSYASLTIGARWVASRGDRSAGSARFSAFRPGRFFGADLYVRGSVGATLRDRTVLEPATGERSTTTIYGGAATVAAGALWLRGEDYGFGHELRIQTTRDRDSFQHSVAILLIAELR